MELYLVGGLILGAVAYLGWRFNKELKKLGSQKPPDIRLEHNNDVVLEKFDKFKQELKKELPEKVLQSVTGSSNTYKGKYGELIGYLSLKAEYDRVVPLGGIVDFIGIKFEDGETVGSVDFIDVKSGKSARLSPDQRKLKKLVDNNKFNFRTIKIDDITLE